MSERLNKLAGQVIDQEFMAPVGTTADFLAFSLGIPMDRVKDLLPVTSQLPPSCRRHSLALQQILA
jgi:hypothetical protein